MQARQLHDVDGVDHAVGPEVAEHAVEQIRIGRDRQVLRGLRRLSEALVVAKEEDLVALDGSAESTAELMTTEIRFGDVGGVIEEGVGR